MCICNVFVCTSVQGRSKLFEGGVAKDIAFLLHVVSIGGVGASSSMQEIC